MHDGAARLAVCIVTYRRPDGLARALRAVAAQVFDGAQPSVRVVVVDNDAEGTAKPVCEAARAAIQWPLDYLVEARRGIPFARNRCVRAARRDTDWIAFIDDDEEPAPNWLAELLRVQAAHDADVVTGPVVSRFAGEVPAWLQGERLFFHRRRYPTGTRRDRAFTGNVLFRAAVFDRVRPHFDERMAMTGGSDVHFSLRVHRAGFRIIWADRAEVHETVPASRIDAGWVYRRAYRIGTATGFIARDLRSLPAAAWTIVPDSGTRLLKGTVLAVKGWLRGEHMLVSGVRDICYGAGMLAGLFGLRYEEYRRTHGE